MGSDDFNDRLGIEHVGRGDGDETREIRLSEDGPDAATVADYDQKLAAAVDKLRTARHGFVLFVPGDDPVRWSGDVAEVDAYFGLSLTDVTANEAKLILATALHAVETAARDVVDFADSNE